MSEVLRYGRLRRDDFFPLGAGFFAETRPRFVPLDLRAGLVDLAFFLGVFLLAAIPKSSTGPIATERCFLALTSRCAEVGSSLESQLQRVEPEGAGIQV